MAQSEKDFKKGLREEFSSHPEKYFAVDVLKKYKFQRQTCEKCSRKFWAVNKSKFCGDSACSGGYRFIGKSPAKHKMDYIQTWKKFSDMFSKLGYTPIKRYPVAARWRDDTDFVQASIYDFQPYVVSGEVSPPANPLVVPQLCLRFNDIDNVGITSAHFTCFVMVGQHAFMNAEEWNQSKYFEDIKKWLNDGLGLDDSEIIFHEDAWAGGGNFGPCMEFFSRGTELGNQVYMMYEKTSDGGRKELKLKVLDMGMGLERNTWFSLGTDTIYDSTFPTVMEKLYKITGIKVDKELVRKFLPYSSYLNFDEAEDIDQTWIFVAKSIGISVEELKEKILPLAALYSVAEHSRSLLVALSDGVLPSNVGGGYNLRVILRRALSFIDKFEWNLDLGEIAEWHADYLKPLFPELSENLEDVKKILEVEKERYNTTKEKAKKEICKIIEKGISEKEMLYLYDCKGISPEMIQQEAKKLGKIIQIPDDFYTRVSELHEKIEQEHSTNKNEKLDLEGIPATKAMYFEDYTKKDFTAEILKIIGDKVILDQTYFYPTSGGQMHDEGKLGGYEITDVFKQGKVIVHVLDKEPKLKKGDKVEGNIDFDYRKQLTQHHTATHIVNAAARKVLGSHVYQAGAKKTKEKAHLDITHYEGLTDEETKKIEKEANKIVNAGKNVDSGFFERSKAEQKYGLSIYQGGAVPGNQIRIINIPGEDIEACGGTHVHNTSEVGEIKILKSSKIQDGIVRITFTAGKSAESQSKGEKELIEQLASVLNSDADQIPGRSKELFDKWKKAKKAISKNEKIDSECFNLISEEKCHGDIISETAEILKTQPEHLVSTASRFVKQLDEWKKSQKNN